MSIEQPERESGALSHGATEAYALLVFTMGCWAGNAVASRLAVGEVSPMVIVCLRWAIVTIFLAGITPRQVIRYWPELRRFHRRISLMAVCGFSLFNALFYISAHYTTAINIAILQGAIPVFVMIGAIVLYGTRITALQVAGIAATIIGVVLIAIQGDIHRLAAFRLNMGDALMLIACLLYSGYTLALRTRPNVPALVFFSAMAAIAFLTSLPLLGYELATGTARWPTTEGWAILTFIALFPSFLAQLAFMRSVRLVGPGRAGIFTNLTPIVGAILAVAILGERFRLSHLAGLVLVVGGIVVAEASARLGARGKQTGI
jgi:drug/metabolite transporter (DMT)-like permease